MIYADNAATTKLDIDAFEAMRPYLLDEYANASQLYSFSRKPKQALMEARTKIAECINAKADEIYFTSGGTESDNWAIKGFDDPKKNYYIITSKIEHHAVLNSCVAVSNAKKLYLEVNNEGVVSCDELEEYLIQIRNNDPTGLVLVSVMFANNEIGTIEPVKRIAEISHQYGAVFHTDAVQAIGHIDIDVTEMGIDMLSASAHKFNGPKGIGFLFVRKGIELQSHNDGGAQEKGKRAGTENVAAIVGMATALNKSVQYITKEKERLKSLEDQLILGLRKRGILFVRNGADEHLPGNISLSFKDAEGEMLLHRLDLMGVCVSTGSACDSKNTQISHVIKAIGLSDEYARGTIRISLGRNNNESDVTNILDALIRILQK